MKILFLAVVFGLQASAGLEPGDRAGNQGERPASPRVCDEAAVNACVAEHARLAAQTDAALPDLLKRLEQVRADLAYVQRAQDGLSVQSRAASATSRLAEEEKKSADTAKIFSGKSIFPSGPAPDSILLLGSRSWVAKGLHGEARRKRLDAVVEASRIRLAQIEDARQKLAIQIEALSAEEKEANGNTQAALGSRNEHGRMCSSGCRQHICGLD